MRHMIRPSFAASLVAIALFASTIAAPPAAAACTDTNTCEGTGALESNTDGEDNSAFGHDALGADVHGSRNTAVGSQALASNQGTGETSCDQFFCAGATANTAVGFSSLAFNTSGSGNTAAGFRALILNISGRYNVASGVSALEGNLTGTNNTATGAFALLANTDGSFNTATGFDAMAANQTGNYNVANGIYALRGFNWDGADRYRQLGDFNAAVGAFALSENDTGNYNAALGYGALRGSGSAGITGEFNTAVGGESLAANASGNGNTAAGYNALRSNSSGFRNTASGIGSLRNLTSGARNIAIGAAAGRNIVTGSDNILIGAETFGRASDQGVIRIGSATYQKTAYIAGVRGVQTGSSSATAVFVDANGQLGTIKSSRAHKEDIRPMGEASGRLMELRPVTFSYRQADLDGRKPVQFGLIAEEVAEAFPELVVYDRDGKPETVSYHLLSTLLLNEVQKGQALAQAQARRIADLERDAAAVAELKREIVELRNKVERLSLAGSLEPAVSMP